MRKGSAIIFSSGWGGFCYKYLPINLFIKVNQTEITAAPYGQSVP
jgi:hypothetical protein